MPPSCVARFALPPFLLITLSLILAACQSSASESPAGSEEARSPRQQATGGTVRIGMGAHPTA